MKKIFLLLLLQLGIATVFGQNMKTRKWRKTELDSLSKAQQMFVDQNYLLALPLFERMQENHPKELYLKYVTGICGLY
nr:hypothetical protein [Bacteroidota bacterium]